MPSVIDTTKPVDDQPAVKDEIRNNWAIIKTEIDHGGFAVGLTPQNYTAADDQVLSHLSGIDDVLAGVNTFIALTDVPSSYNGAAGYLVKVNAAQDGLEFVEDTTLSNVVEDTTPELGGSLDCNGNSIIDYVQPHVTGVSGTLTQAAHGGRPILITGTVTVPVADGFNSIVRNKSGSSQTVEPASGNLIHEGATKASISLPTNRAVMVHSDGTDVWVEGAIA